MKKTKKNNKGFSLVELIVVVLIMGIIAVALAPQVMKWVDNSKINSDKNNAKALKSSIQTALSEWQIGNPLPAGKTGTANINGSSTSLTGLSDFAGLDLKIEAVTAKDYPKTQYDTAGFDVTIDGDTGKVEVKCSADSAALK